MGCARAAGDAAAAAEAVTAVAAVGTCSAVAVLDLASFTRSKRCCGFGGDDAAAASSLSTRSDASDEDIACPLSR